MDLADVGSVCISFEDSSLIGDLEEQVNRAIEKRANALLDKINRDLMRTS